MDQILWIRSIDYDPAVRVGMQVQPNASLPLLEVVERQPVVMMFETGQGWEVKPFTQLKLRIVGQQERSPENGSGAGIPWRERNGQP